MVITDMTTSNPYTPLPCLNPSPYGEHLKGPVPASAAMDPNYYLVAEVRRPDDGVGVVRRLLYHLSVPLIGIIAEGANRSRAIEGDRLHTTVFSMAYAGVSGAKAERLTLALELCKRLRTHLGVEEVETFIQAPHRELGGRTPLDVLATWPARKARKALQPVMIAHLLSGVRKAVLAVERNAIL